MTILISAVVGGIVGFFVAVIVTASGERDRLRHQRNIDRLLSGLQGAAKEQGDSVHKALETVVGSAEEGRQFAAIVDEALKTMRGQLNAQQSKIDRFANRVEATEDRLREIEVAEQNSVALAGQNGELAKRVRDLEAWRDISLNKKGIVKKHNPPKSIVGKVPKSKSEARRLAVQKEASKKV